MIEALLSLLGEVYFLLATVSGRGTFPPPLSPDEEALALRGLGEGKAEARARLIEHNLRLVAHIAKKYATCGIEQDDLLSIGTIGLIKGVNSYRPEAGTQLATYAARCIENEIRMAIRARKKQKSEVSLSDSVGVDKEGNEVSLLDILGSAPDMVESEVERRLRASRLLHAVRTALSPKERVVIEQRYGLNGRRPRPQREVAQALDISRSYVSRLEKKAVQKLAKALEGDEDGRGV